MESGRKDGLAEEEEEAEKQATQPKLQLKCCANNFERQFVNPQRELNAKSFAPHR